jgi:hypothetical protein
MLVVLGLGAGVALLVKARSKTSDLVSPDRPCRLVVLVVFDQLRADYLSRWQSLFGDGGFQRLQRDGAWFRNCHYPYADTVTGAGHASLLTGCSPSEHGIVGNEWFDRATGRMVNCVAGDRYQQVPTPPTAGMGRELVLGKRARGGVSPEQLLTPTLGEVLKEATQDRARIVSLSLKDRAAVLPGGRRADVCCWFDGSTGRFVTSSYYRDRLPSWVKQFNQSRRADHWFGQDWTRLNPDLDYVRYSGPDDVPGEGTGVAQGRTFPHPLTGALPKPGFAYYEALTCSPFGNELLLELTRRAIEAESLGQREVPDLLCVSFSSNDLIGHIWGPDSQEVLDVTLRSDLVVQELLDLLDAKVGKGNYLLALTADHGVCPLPEVSRSRGEDAGRLDPKALTQKAEAFLDQTFSQPPNQARWIEVASYPWVYLNRRTLKAHQADQSKVEEALAQWFQQQPGILTAYTRTQLLQGLPESDAMGQCIRRSFHPERSGDVVVVVKPWYIMFPSLTTGTTHGTPHPYDTHVPLLVYGPGIHPTAAQAQEEVAPPAVAAIFAEGLGIDPPAKAQYTVPASLAAPKP